MPATSAIAPAAGNPFRCTDPYATRHHHANITSAVRASDGCSVVLMTGISS
jgi:hypothetical protein